MSCRRNVTDVLKNSENLVDLRTFKAQLLPGNVSLTFQLLKRTERAISPWIFFTYKY